MSGSQWLRVLAAASLLGASMSACSGVDPTAEGIGTSEQALTGGCGGNIQNVGLPCDPDGSGPAQECEGVCALRGGTGPGGTTASVQCVAVATSTGNDGKICGASGSGDCTKHCVGKLCVGTAAPKGAACRPGGSFTASICDGACDGAGACVALASTSKCPANKTGDCTYDFCSATNSTTCVQIPLPKGYTCNDSSTCTSGDSCDGAGKCTGTAKVCPSSGSPCLVNACVASSGACVASPSPGTACTLTADKCSAGICDSTGACVKGAALSCDDGDACTVDACDAATGCTHTAKSCPPPSDACTVATCDKTSGACGFVAKSCDDGNPCTADSCNASTGCAHAPIAGCSFDAGAADTGTTPKDSGTTTIDSGTVTVDSGTTTTDSGTVTVDSGTTTEDTGGTVEEDSGSTLEDSGSTSSDSGSATDAGEDAGAGLEETVEAGGCGCRTTGTSGSGASATVALGVLALVAARRRRVR